MPKSRIYLSYLLCLVLGISILIPKNSSAGGGGNGMGMIGTIGGGLLIWHGYTSLTKDKAKCSSIAWSAACGKVALDVLEIAGGAAAMMMNMGNEADTRDDGGFTAGLTEGGSSGGGGGGGLSGGGLGGLPGIDLSDCVAPNCKVDENGRPTITLPPLDDMKATVTKGFNGNAVNADGVSLEDALKTLDNNYDQAKQAVAAFNNAAAAGKLDSALGVDGNGAADLAGTGSGNNNEETGLNRGTAGKLVAGADGGGTPTDIISLGGGSPLDLEALMNKTKTERGGPADAKAVGLNLESSRTGKLLNIWERVTRAIRGTRDRDLSLAKIEVTRKIALKNLEKNGKKDPNVASSHEKL